MLDVTTNQASTTISHGPYCNVDLMDEAAELLLDEDMMMDPLFEEDWLHENNLDILFDLFEEEIESKVGGDANNSSSALFGTSPVTSYLFGTSPSLASALDLIYFDNQQQALGNMASAPTTEVASTTSTTAAVASASSSNQSTSTAKTIANIVNSAATNINQAVSNESMGVIVKGTTVSARANSIGVQQANRANNNPTNSAKNAMRIKRGLKKGHSEGTSLLAKPGLSNNVSKANGNFNSSSDISSSSNNKGASSKQKNIRDKTSVTITNFRNSIIIGNATTNVINRNGIDINYSKQSQQQNRERYYLSRCQQHVHYITGRAVIREHAYAVRGH